jgi:hypothetical protein
MKIQASRLPWEKMYYSLLINIDFSDGWTPNPFAENFRIEDYG